MNQLVLDICLAVVAGIAIPGVVTELRSWF
jgi:hypothetical protein